MQQAQAMQQKMQGPASPARTSGDRRQLGAGLIKVTGQRQNEMRRVEIDVAVRAGRQGRGRGPDRRRGERRPAKVEQTVQEQM